MGAIAFHAFMYTTLTIFRYKQLAGSVAGDFIFPRVNKADQNILKVANYLREAKKRKLSTANRMWNRSILFMTQPWAHIQSGWLLIYRIIEQSRPKYIESS